MTLFKIHGAFGSGKTYVVRQFLEANGSGEKILIPGRRGPKVEAHYLPALNLYILGGDYTDYSRTVAGTDAIQPFSLVLELVEQYTRQGHVIMEGMITSYQRWRDWSLARGPGSFVWLFMDTPLEVCIARVAARNGGRPFNHANVRSKWESADSCWRKAIAAGEENYRLSWQDPLPALQRAVARYAP